MAVTRRNASKEMQLITLTHKWWYLICNWDLRYGDISKHAYMLSNIYGNHDVALRIGFALPPKRNLLPKADFSSDAVVASFCFSDCFSLSVSSRIDKLSISSGHPCLYSRSQLLYICSLQILGFFSMASLQIFFLLLFTLFV